MNKLLSNCCNAPMTVGGEGKTHWYICQTCGKACDISDDNKQFSGYSKENPKVKYDEVEELSEIIRRYQWDSGDESAESRNMAKDILKLGYSKTPTNNGLVSINKDELFRISQECIYRSNIPKNTIEYIGFDKYIFIDKIISKFGRKEVPSVDEIHQIINESHRKRESRVYSNMDIAQAVHNLLTKKSQ